MIYLDNNATTQIDPEVVDEMLPYLNTQYGNPGSIYTLGRESRRAIDLARERVARFVNARPDQVIFTSGGTEANNLALYSQLPATNNGHPNNYNIVISNAEHASIMATARRLSDLGFLIPVRIPINNRGLVTTKDFNKSTTEGTRLVSVMMVNNEVGTRNPIEEIAAICRDKHIVFHTDCVQAASSEKLDFLQLGCDMMSISSHKIHGPKGVGALITDVPMQPMICGGLGQEFGIRAGTENVAGIVGFGKACELMKNNIEAISKYTSQLKCQFCDILSDELCRMKLSKCVTIHGLQAYMPGKTVNLCFDGVDGETLLLLLDKQGVCVSSGAACSSLESKPSHVLLAMGVSADEARNSIRISFSKFNTHDEICQAARILAHCVQTIRQITVG